nr:MAG TPA: hypothetical protein [Caudoviricetes sp.]DAP10472.1 MAG TPA: hypothetical protein [Caudoviricetes sp.]
MITVVSDGTVTFSGSRPFKVSITACTTLDVVLKLVYCSFIV